MATVLAEEFRGTRLTSVDEHILENVDGTPPCRSMYINTECWMAPMKPVRRKVWRLVRADNGLMVSRDLEMSSPTGAPAEFELGVTSSYLRPFPTFDLMTSAADSVVCAGNLEKILAAESQGVSSGIGRSLECGYGVCKRRSEFATSRGVVHTARACQ